jgi:hypothetical protein
MRLSIPKSRKNPRRRVFRKPVSACTGDGYKDGRRCAKKREEVGF